jgi:hypothetical protein
MALEDYWEPEVGVAVAVTAALASPKMRAYLRRGAVYGLAGVLKIGDAVSAAAGGVKRGLQSAATEARTDADLPVTEAEPVDTASEGAAPSQKRPRKTTEAVHAE